MANGIGAGFLPLMAAVAGLLAAASSATAGEVDIITTNGMDSVHVISLREARFRTVVRQEHDFSCGSAALATLLSYHYGRPMPEDAVFKSMFKVGDQKAIRKNGFSLADMQRFLASLGYHSDGYRVPLDRIAQVGIPAITLINTKGYNHFVVIKGIQGDDVLLGDPAAGLRVEPRAEFLKSWQGIVFIIHDDPAMARQHFNRSDEWMVRRKAPFGTALNRQGLATYSTMFPGLFQFSY